MIQNVFKLAFRNLRKQPGYTAINLLGLSLGLAACLLIALWVQDELQFDRFHEHADRIYQTQGDVRFGGADMHIACSSAPMAAALLKDYPQIEAVCRFRRKGSLSVRRDDRVFTENSALFADASVFEIFTFPLAEGDPHSALLDPNSVVISEKVAQKYFSGRSPLGETLHFDKNWTAKITGVMRDIPENSHIRADYFLSMESLEESKEDNWLSFNFSTYILFREGYDPEAFQAEWLRMVQRYVAPVAERILGIKWADFEKNDNRVVFGMMPMTRIHLHGGNRMGEMGPNGSIETVRVFSVVALFILLLAAVNFMNLSTARAARRAREVGVRKVMGSQRSQLVGQFLGESVLLSFLAAVPALLAVRLLLRAFNGLAEKNIALNFWNQPELLLGIIGFILLTGLLAGVYPAFVLSGFQPIKALKSNDPNAGLAGGARLRNVLVTGQFVISTALIVGALVTWRQMHFIENKNLGFDRDQVLVVTDALMLGDKAEVFKSEVLALPSVESGTISSYLPTNDYHNDQAYFKDKIFNPENGVSLNDWWVDADYLKTMRIRLLEGRNFDPTSPADSNALLINRQAARVLGFSNPLDREIYTLKDAHTGEIESFRIIGVLEDFHFQSLRDEIAPLIMHRGNSRTSISFRLRTDDVSTAVAQVGAIWKKTAPMLPFNYQFMDEQFDRQYRAERRAGTLILYFAVLAIAIACLGLFGLAAFTAQRRTKEIGIRKILGASVASVVGMLSKDFLKLVLLALLLASPVAWYFMEKWLQNFAYRIEIAWWMFALAGAVAVLVAFATVSVQSIRAALANPVNSLRSE
ncbi:MAG: ABC transporter permease [Saprospiraceae bacterium]|jgi:putative ABC transport system permease protein|nr:ABC transporter permease [Saprospiraceae bacterium]